MEKPIRFRSVMMFMLLASSLGVVAVGQSVRRPLSAPYAADYRLAFTLGDTDFGENSRYRTDTLAGVAVSAEGDTLVANTNSAQIDVFDSGGRFLRSFGGPGSGKAQFKGLKGVAISPFGDIVVADTGNNRLQVFDRQDKFLFAIGGEGAEPGQFRQPQGVAVGPEGNLVVADTGNDRLQVFDRTGRFLRAFGGPATGGGTAGAADAKKGPVVRPIAVAVAHSGRIVVVDHDRSQVFDGEGRLLFVISDSRYSINNSRADDTLRDPQSVAVDNDDNIVFVDGGNSRIAMFDKQGRFLRAFFSDRLNPIFYNLSPVSNYSPVSVAIAPSGKIVTAERGGYCVDVYAPDGTLAFSFGHYDIGGAGDLYRPHGIALTPKGNLLVADTMNNRIQAFDRQGKFLFMFGRLGYGDGLFSNPTSVAVSPSGEIVVADSYNYRIQVFDSKGKFKFAFGSKGKREGEFDEPFSVAVSPSGEIVVAAFKDDRIQIFDSKGKFLRAFTDLEPDPRGGGHFYPKSLAVDAFGNIAASGGDNRIWVFDKNGKRLARVGGEGADNGEFFYPDSVAVLPNDRIVIADVRNKRVQVFDSRGKFHCAFGGALASDGRAPYLGRVWVSPSGEIYAECSTHTGSNIQVFDSNGRFLRFSTEAEPRLNDENEMKATAPNGDIVIADRESHTVWVYAPTHGNSPLPFRQRIRPFRQRIRPFGQGSRCYFRMTVIVQDVCSGAREAQTMGMLFALLGKTCMLVTLTFVLTRTRFFAHLFRPRLPAREQITALLAFLLMGFMEEAIAHQQGMMNIRIVAVCAAGLLAGPWVGGAVGLAVTAMSCLSHPFPLPPIGISMILAGLGGGLLHRWRPTLALRPSAGFALGFSISLLRYGLALIYGSVTHNRGSAEGLASEAVEAVMHGGGVALVLLVVEQVRLQESQARAVALAEVRALQARMNPHFLFNALNTLSALSTIDPRAIPRAAARLGLFLRASLDQNDRPLICLQEELDVIGAYLDVESMRLGERLRVEQSIAPALLGALVPPFLLQPLIENAVCHGIQPGEQGGLIRLEARQEKAGLFLIVSDTGIGMEPEERMRLFRTDDGHVHALTLLRRRLHGLYGKNFLLSVESERGEGTTVTVRLPLQQTGLFSDAEEAPVSEMGTDRRDAGTTLLR